MRCLGERSRRTAVKLRKFFPRLSNRSVSRLVQRHAAGHVLANSTVPMSPERKKKSELVRELTKRDEQLIATAVESAMDRRLENEVLYLQYPQPSVNEFIFSDFQRKSALDATAKQIGIAVNVS